MLKAYMWLQTSDGSIQQVEQELAMFCPIIYKEIHSGMGTSKNYPISLPSRVSPPMLSLILDYCRFHQLPGRSNKERKSFDDKFVRMDTNKLCDLASAADSLKLKPLVDLTSRALARIIEGKTPEEIRDIFHIPDDLTEEEKLEPIKNFIDDPKIRLLNRLYARKRKELKERDTIKNIEAEDERADERSVDDLLSFINGGSEDSKGSRDSKNKKKNHKRKDHHKSAPPNNTGTSNDTSSSNNDVHMDKESVDRDAMCSSSTVNGNLISNFSSTTKFLDVEDDRFVADDQFDDWDSDDDIEPALKEKIDREVEDFARRLNSDWSERWRESLSQGQDRTLSQLTTRGNGFLRRSNGNGSFRRSKSLDRRPK